MSEKYISVYEAKELICEVGRRIYNRGFVAANDGNISIRIAPDTIIATPTFVSKGFMKPEMMVTMKLDGTILAKGDYNPSSEVKMHIRAYQENPEIMAVVHAHPPVATSFACAGISLDQAILTEAVLTIGTIPIAKYGTPSTVEIPDSIAPYCKDYNAVLLANHGALTWGRDVIEALYRMEGLEHYATMVMYTQHIIGKSNVLSCDQISELVEVRNRLGIKTGGVPPCALNATNTQDVVRSAEALEKEDLEDIINRVTNEVLAKMGI